MKFIIKAMFYTDQNKLAPHIAICRYLVVIQYKPKKLQLFEINILIFNFLRPLDVSKPTIMH